MTCLSPPQPLQAHEKCLLTLTVLENTVAPIIIAGDSQKHLPAASVYQVQFLWKHLTPWLSVLFTSALGPLWQNYLSESLMGWGPLDESEHTVAHVP